MGEHAGASELTAPQSSLGPAVLPPMLGKGCPNSGQPASGGFNLLDGDETHASYPYRHTYMGDGQEPQLEMVRELPYSNEKAYWLIDLISATPDVLGDGFGYSAWPFIPAIGTSYPYGSQSLIDRPTTTTYTAAGADLYKFGVSDSGLSLTPVSELVTSGKYDDIQFDNQTMIVNPDRFGSQFTITARTTESIIHTTDGLVSGVESKDVTLTMPVTTPSYNQHLIPLRESFSDGTGSGGDGFGSQGRAAPAPLLGPPRLKDGFDLNTLTRGMADEMPIAGGETTLTGHHWTVRIQGGNTIRPFEPLPRAQQPEATQKYLNTVENPGGGQKGVPTDIRFNCAAYAFGLVDVADNQGVSRSFWLWNGRDAMTVRDELCEKRPLAKDTRNGDLVTFGDGDGRFEHVAVVAMPMTTRNPRTQQVDSAWSLVS